MSKRALRRHCAEVRKLRARYYYGGAHAQNIRARGIHARTPTTCSCEMCGNPRRHFGDRSLQERRALGRWRRVEERR